MISDLLEAVLVLAFRLAEGDLRRADELAAKARAGTLTVEEREQLEACAFAETAAVFPARAPTLGPGLDEIRGVVVQGFLRSCARN